ncbi:diguanylate cyclase [Clostridium perfringens]|uniref:diguanylate cyclase n=1 Tax=Clostridium perfringens TaxID=1502 RepID=UPI000D70CADD|nr:diguanylate cyclase [Clostridium perfringens]PWW92625.1 diguanylate cyclase [Clostridium perfringens]PWX73095.1 diguanylate cyclase [Clostridium perfringens]
MFIISNNLILVMLIIALVVSVLSAWDKRSSREEVNDTIRAFEDKRYKYIVNIKMNDGTISQIVAYSNHKYDEVSQLINIISNKDLDSVIYQAGKELMLIPRKDIESYELIVIDRNKEVGKLGEL